MIKREFIKPTSEEINERKRMYSEAESLGIDLMSFDNNSKDSITRRKKRRKAILLIGTGKPIPQELKKALTVRK